MVKNCEIRFNYQNTPQVLHFTVGDTAADSDVEQAAQRALRSRFINAGVAGVPVNYDVFIDNNNDGDATDAQDLVLSRASNGDLFRQAGQARPSGASPLIYNIEAARGDLLKAGVMDIEGLDSDPTQAGNQTFPQATALKNLRYAASDSDMNSLSAEESADLIRRFEGCFEDNEAGRRQLRSLLDSNPLISFGSLESQRMRLTSIYARANVQPMNSLSRTETGTGSTSPAANAVSGAAATTGVSGVNEPRVLRHASVAIGGYTETPAAGAARNARGRNVPARTVNISFTGKRSGMDRAGAEDFMNALRDTVGDLNSMPAAQREAIMNARVSGDGFSSPLFVRDIATAARNNNTVFPGQPTNASTNLGADSSSGIDYTGMRRSTRDKSRQIDEASDLLLIIMITGGLTKEMLPSWMAQQAEKMGLSTSEMTIVLSETRKRGQVRRREIMDLLANTTGNTAEDTANRTRYQAELHDIDSGDGTITSLLEALGTQQSRAEQRVQQFSSIR